MLLCRIAAGAVSALFLRRGCLQSELTHELERQGLIR